MPFSTAFLKFQFFVIKLRPIYSLRESHKCFSSVPPFQILEGYKTKQIMIDSEKSFRFLLGLNQWVKFEEHFLKKLDLNLRSAAVF